MLNSKTIAYCYYSEEQEKLTGAVYYQFENRIIRLTEIKKTNEQSCFPDASLIAQGPLEHFIFIRRENNNIIYPW